jgi:signal transduction histidine kinase
VVGDAVRLLQVFNHLVGNAVKFTDSGSIFIALQVRDEKAVVRVRDTGQGIPSDQLASIFDPFTQASMDLARTPGGLGIGLSIAKDMIERHGGSIEARSEGPGKGAEVVVWLPLLRRP